MRNNAAERALRGVAFGRMSWIVAGSEAGASALPCWGHGHAAQTGRKMDDQERLLFEHIHDMLPMLARIGFVGLWGFITRGGGCVFRFTWALLRPDSCVTA